MIVSISIEAPIDILETFIDEFAMTNQKLEYADASTNGNQSPED